VERGEYLLYLEGKLKNIRDVKRAVELILTALDIVEPEVDGDLSDEEHSIGW